MRIAISTRVVQAQGYDEPRDALSHDWQAWCERYNLQPVLVPNTLQDPCGFVESFEVAAILLTGGNDAVERHGGDYAQARNKTEFKLLAFAEAKRLPVFAVCRGMHVINLYFGGTVKADIGARHVGTDHELTLLDCLTAYTGLSGNVETNSFHSQGIAKDGLATSLLAAALSSDGLVEALMHRELPIIGVQWHPERPSPSSELDHALVNRLISEARPDHG